MKNAKKKYKNNSGEEKELELERRKTEEQRGSRGPYLEFSSEQREDTEASYAGVARRRQSTDCELRARVVCVFLLFF